MTPDPIERYLRPHDPTPDATHLLLRGSPLTIGKFIDQAEDFALRFTFQGGRHPGLSFALAVDESDADAQMAGRRLSRRAFIGVTRVRDVRLRGFVLLPTFEAPHYTLITGLATSATLESLLTLVSADTRRNPHARREGGK